METIAAIATAPGNAGVGIVRVSGEDSFKIIGKILKTKQVDITANTIRYGYIIDRGKIIDEVLVSFFKAPKSFTMENTCEINCHGGSIVTKKVLELCLKNGARLAEPGEFTKRAFLNGRIDLSQAEAIIDVINAKTEKEVTASMKQLNGELSNIINNIRRKVMDILVNIEASIDYPEYDVEEVTNEKTLRVLEEIQSEVNTLKSTFDNGKIIRDGLKVAIIGKPNAGKSSLLNAILNEERAIVTEIEGTTRDTIEEYIQIEGIPIKIIDTAGIRNTENLVEKIGIEKSIETIDSSDVTIVIIDGSKELQKEDKEILKMIKNKKSIILLNKVDKETKIEKEEILKYSDNKPVIRISALKRSGIDEIYEEISKMYNFGEISVDDSLLITNERHKELIINIEKNIEKAKNTIIEKMPIDIITIHITEILAEIGKITGDGVSEDIINEIFKKFCLGK